jgi:hypothetical protein
VVLEKVQPEPIFAPKSRSRVDRNEGMVTHITLAKVTHITRMSNSIGVQTVLRFGGAFSIAFDWAEVLSLFDLLVLVAISVSLVSDSKPVELSRIRQALVSDRLSCFYSRLLSTNRNILRFARWRKMSYWTKKP